MSADVRPVRCWVEYDEWSGYMEFREEWLEWTWAEIPRGATGELYVDKNEVNSIEEAVQAWGGERNFGPLRSLRVLLSTGHEVTVTPYSDEDIGRGALWKVGSLVQAGVQADSDSEAVQRALDAAIRWVAEHREAAQ